MLSEAWQRLHVEVMIYRIHLNLNPSSYFKFDKFSFLLHSTRHSRFDFNFLNPTSIIYFF